MPLINLLPWREWRREEHKKQLYWMLVATAFVAAGLLGCMQAYVNHKMAHQQQRLVLLRQEITRLDRELDEISQMKKRRKELLSRIASIQELQVKRNLIVHLFEELVRLLPTGIYLDALEKTGTLVTVMGKAESNSQISTFMRKIEQSPWLMQPVLQEIMIKDESNRYRNDFTLQLRLREPTIRVKQDEMSL